MEGVVNRKGLSIVNSQRGLKSEALMKQNIVGL